MHAALTPHAPIYINGNAGFTAPDPVNGGGSGTLGNPYIIENYIIDASTANGIDIRNTTAYFVVRNSVVENGLGTYFGIYLYNAVNGRIDNNTCGNNEDGILLLGSDNNTLSNNTCGNNRDGIRLLSSDNNVLSNNTCENNYIWNGIRLADSWYNLVENNIVENNGNGIVLDSNSSNNTLSNNTCENNEYGIWLLLGSDNNLVTNNLAENNRYYGIRLVYSDNNVLSNNICENNSYGIRLANSWYNRISNNTVENNHFGIYLWLDSNSNHIYHNNIINNTIQAYDNRTNYWDNGYPSGGNYWSDYTDVDNYQGENQDIPGSDGIGDTPYDNILGGNNRDRYPLYRAAWRLVETWMGTIESPPPWSGTAVFSLTNLYTVNVEKILDLYAGSKLVVKFYDYSDAFENENVIETFSPPWHVEENESARHSGGVKEAKLVLTDGAGAVIDTIATFTVTRDVLNGRIVDIYLEWPFADLERRNELNGEIVDIYLQWAFAPS